MNIAVFTSAKECEARAAGKWPCPPMNLLRYHYVGVTKRSVQMEGDTRTRVTVILTLWLFAVLFFMILGLQMNLEVFFVLWLIGLLVLTELTDTTYTLPRQLRYVRYLIAAGVIIFGVLVAKKVMEILSS
jgi:hypothetical protein